MHTTQFRPHGKRQLISCATQERKSRDTITLPSPATVSTILQCFRYTAAQQSAQSKKTVVSFAERHGICRTDAEVDAVRCFCDEGYSGSDCGTKGGSSQAGYGGIIAILIILFILMIGMGGVIFYLAKQMVAFKKDNRYVHELKRK